MSTKSVQDVNCELARKINEDARGNSKSPYAGKFVGIADGKVVAVSNDFDEMTRQLRIAEPDPQKTVWIEASVDYDEVQQVWRLA
jgi:hypothetical protein